MMLSFVVFLGFFAGIVYASSLSDINALSYRDLLDQAIARFTCPGNQVAVFSPSKSCSSSSYSAVCKSTGPEFKIQAKFSPGDCVTVIGTPTWSFAFVMLSDSWAPFYMDVRFYNGKLVRVTRQGYDTWVDEESNTPHFPFTADRQFNLTVCTDHSMFKTWVDGTALFDYNYRDPLNTVTAIQLKGNVTVRTIVFCSN